MAVFALGTLGARAVGGDLTRYRVVGPSAVSVFFFPGGVATNVANVPLRGTFALEASIGPMDWDVFLLRDVDWTARDGGGGRPLRISGAGSYRSGGRGAPRQQFTLDGTVGGTAISLASDLVATTRSWPFLEIDLVGSTTNSVGVTTYSVHLLAIRELAFRHFEVVGDSTSLDDCSICDRISFPMPLRGGFDLVVAEETPVSSHYYLTDIDWVVAPGAGVWSYRLLGQADLQFGGEVVVQQHMEMQLTKVDSGGSREAKLVDSGPLTDQPWPLMNFDLNEPEGTLVSRLELHVRAAPMLGLWISTARSMTPSYGPRMGMTIGPGDILDWRGGVVFNGTELVAGLGLQGAPSPLNVDALSVADDGSVWFSLDQAVTGSTLGAISSGDILGDHGERVLRGRDLMLAFGLEATAGDVGVDAFNRQADGTIYFSIDRAVKSTKLVVVVGDGDVLRNDGTVFRTSKALLEAFQPAKETGDPGLDALHVWSSGEVWFSTRQRFTSGTLGTILDGDLLSSRGYRVSRNSELTAPFAPLEDLADFGLDALFVVPDGAAWDPVAPRLRSIAVPSVLGEVGVTLRWMPTGRVVRVERTFDLAKPFETVVDRLGGTEFRDGADLPGHGCAFYRLVR